MLSDIFGKNRILSSATYMSSSVERPGVIKKTGVVKLLIGALHEKSKQTCQHICDVLKEAGIDTTIMDDIRNCEMEKLFGIRLSIRFRRYRLQTLGEILDDEELRRTAETVCREVLEIEAKTGFRSGIKCSMSSSGKRNLHGNTTLQMLQRVEQQTDGGRIVNRLFCETREKIECGNSCYAASV